MILPGIPSVRSSASALLNSMTRSWGCALYVLPFMSKETASSLVIEPSVALRVIATKSRFPSNPSRAMSLGSP